jgi:hypothetical protein
MENKSSRASHMCIQLSLLFSPFIGNLGDTKCMLELIKAPTQNELKW